MNHMVDMMREHVPDGTRIHYVITDGGKAPNVVPDFAEGYYYVRHQDARIVNEVWDRIVKAAEGAALGTETKMEQEVVNGVYALLPNETLARVVDANLRAVGGVKYTAEERAFAEKIRTTLGDDLPPVTQADTVLPFAPRGVATGGSTDVGDVSWVVPNGRFYAATWVPGTPCAFVAGRRGGRHEHRAQGNDRGGQDAGVYRVRSHDRRDAGAARAGGVRPEARRELHVSSADRRTLAAVELSGERVAVNWVLYPIPGTI